MILLVLCGVAAGAQSATPDAMSGMDMGTPKTGTAPQQKPGGEMNGMDMMQMHQMHMGMTGKGTPVPAGTLRVVYGEKTVDVTVAELAALPHTTVTLANPHSKVSETYSGVPLMALLMKAGVAEQPEGKDLSLYLVAEGTDGYKAVYSVAEVAPSTHDATVMVADSMDGKKLEGGTPFLLVASRETRRVRWVKNLSLVQVRLAE